MPQVIRDDGAFYAWYHTVEDTAEVPGHGVLFA